MQIFDQFRNADLERLAKQRKINLWIDQEPIEFDSMSSKEQVNHTKTY